MLQYTFAAHAPVYTFPWKQPKRAEVCIECTEIRKASLRAN